MTTDTVGVAVIGLGTVGLRYVEQFQRHDGFTLVGGFDVSADACQTATDRFDVTCAESADALIGSDAVDLVYVAVPPLWHEQYVDLVIERRKALLCEKPLGVDDAQSAAMVDRVEASGLPAAVNFVFGAAPSAVALIDAVRSQRGSVHSADLRVHFEQWPRAWQAGAGWLRDRDQGGWTREVVSHYVFLLLRLFGPPTIVASHVELPADGTSEQRLTAVLRCGDVGVHVLGSSDSAGADEVEFTVRGTDTSWRLTNWYEYATAAPGGAWAPALDADAAGGPAAYRAQLDQMRELAHGRVHTLASFAEALEVQQVVEALLADR